MTERGGRLTARALSTGYANRQVLRDLTFDVQPGTFTALLGPNGSGKSTLLRALTRLHPPSSGTVLLDGTDIAGMKTREVARRIGLLPQGAVAPEGLRVTDLVRQGRYPHRPLFGGWTDRDAEAVSRALDMTQMAHLSDRALDTLSGGQRQRVWIAMALAQRAPILLLDEPTTWLDLAHQLDLMELIGRLVREEGMTVVAVLHDLNQAARYCDRLVMLKDGRILNEGEVDEVFRAENIARSFGVTVDVLRDARSGRPYCLPVGRLPDRT